MLQILHRGMNINPSINEDGFTGDPVVDAALAYVLSLLGGRIVSLDTNGKVQLADGSADSASVQQIVLGFIINNAAGYTYENKPALASKIVPVIMGNCEIITDQIVTTETFVPGDPLYVGTGANIGLVTNTPSTSGFIIGVAGSSASNASPELKIYRS